MGPNTGSSLPASLGAILRPRFSAAYNLHTFWARKLKLGMILPRARPFNALYHCPRVMPVCRARGQNI